jgi:ribonucleoside-diphosphate reductase alpha chain
MKLPSQFQQFIHLSRYARYLPEKNRRENWEETVDRYIQFFQEKFSEVSLKEVRTAILNLEVMPSMRSLMTAGKALERDHMAGYNCSYLSISHPRAFDEVMYVLMCGTGVGFSVERQYINKLPVVAEEFHESNTVISVADSKLGWASAYRELVSLLFSGRIPTWDVSRVRSGGARLKTFGGRASGARPLEDLFEFTIKTFRESAGRKLNSIECHDLVCKIGDIVVVGGVRRSALISLSNLSDDRMRIAKSGQWWEQHGHRALANNSVAYTEKPDMAAFMKEWESLYLSFSGERGIYNRQAVKDFSPERRERIRDTDDIGTNPCSEINLLDCQLCNLSEVIVRPEDTVETLTKKVRVATIIGTMQSSLTNFRYVRPSWKHNCEDEALLGVSLTGIMDNDVLSGRIKSWNDVKNFDLPKTLEHLRDECIKTNIKYAKLFGVNPSTAITCVKPSGTVSQLTNTASGIHPRHSEYYIRSVRQDNKDPLTAFMVDKGFKYEPAFGKEDSTTVFYFPVQAPKKSVMREDRNAIEQLEHWLVYQKHWCEHKPSITVYVKEDEWLEVGAWVYKHFNVMSGVSFLPFDGGVYKQAPYQECKKSEYTKLLKATPDVVWEELEESDDNTSSSQTLACTGGACEL